MAGLKLVLPEEKYKAQILDFKREFVENGEVICGGAELESVNSFEEWLSSVRDRRNADNLPAHLVPATVFLAVLERPCEVVGIIDLRHRLNDRLLSFGGNLGYSIRKSRRRQGFAVQMLRLALDEAAAMNIQKALVTCSRANLASAKTIIKCGGILENEIQGEGRITQRYWILTLKNTEEGRGLHEK